MFRCLRRVLHVLKGIVLIGVSIAFIARLLASLVWIGCSLPLFRRLAVWRFRRRLKKSGLEPLAADALTEEYEDGLALFGRRPSREAP